MATGHFNRTVLVYDGYVKYHLNRKRGVFIQEMDKRTSGLTKQEQNVLIEACVSLERRLRQSGYRGTKL